MLSQATVILQSWIRVMELQRAPPSPIAVIMLRQTSDKVTALEALLQELRPLVGPTHYCMAQVASRLSDACLQVCGQYEALLSLSPNNKKLAESLANFRDKYAKYTKMLEAALKVCYPKYGQN